MMASLSIYHCSTGSSCLSDAPPPEVVTTPFRAWKRAKMISLPTSLLPTLENPEAFASMVRQPFLRQENCLRCSGIHSPGFTPIAPSWNEPAFRSAISYSVDGTRLQSRLGSRGALALIRSSRPLRDRLG
jgi:hypothetical protein